jgi:hypothetical protein
VLRSDAALQGSAQTVLIMRREAAVLIAPKPASPEGHGSAERDARHHARRTDRRRLLGPVLDYYGSSATRRSISRCRPTRSRTRCARRRSTPFWWSARLRPSSQRRVAEPRAAQRARSSSSRSRRPTRSPKRVPALEKIEVEQGAFGGRPPRPPESFNTLAFSVRLVATPKSDTDKIAELVKQLYLIRQNISAAVPGAGLMETPDVDEADAVLIHPGTRAYSNGEQKN